MAAAPTPLRVFITGASSGIGAALARGYARRGAVLGLVGRREAALRELAESLGTVTRPYVADVRMAEALADAAAAFTGEFGAPDVVIANAGVSYGTLTERADDYEAFREILATNVNGMAATFAPFIPALQERGDGTLVGVASVAGYRGLPGSEAYSASKAAAIVYLESLRIRLRAHGIAVITISPGYIDTPMTRGNPYPMPFLLDADRAAAAMIRAIDRRARYTIVPWPMAIVARLLRLIPNAVWDRLMARAPHKPRKPQ